MGYYLNDTNSGSTDAYNSLMTRNPIWFYSQRSITRNTDGTYTQKAILFSAQSLKEEECSTLVVVI